MSDKIFSSPKLEDNEDLLVFREDFRLNITLWLFLLQYFDSSFLKVWCSGYGTRTSRTNWTRKNESIFSTKKESLNQLKITNILFNAFVRTKSKRVKSVQMFSWGTITKLVSKLEHNHVIKTQETDLQKSHRVK